MMRYSAEQQWRLSQGVCIAVAQGNADCGREVSHLLDTHTDSLHLKDSGSLTLTIGVSHLRIGDSVRVS